MTGTKFYKLSYNFIDNSSLILVALYPLALIAGNLFINLFIFLISFNFFLNIRNNIYFLKQKSFYIFIFFFSTLILNLIFSINFENTAPRVIKILFIIFFIFELQRIIQKFDDSHIKTIFKFWSLLFVILSLDIIFEILFGKNLLGFKSYLPGRIASFFGDELVVGAFYHGFVLFFLSYLINSKSKNYILLLSVFAVILISFLIGERSNFIKLFISVLFFFLFVFRINYKTKISMIFLLAVSFLSVINFDDEYKKRYYDQIIPLFSLSGYLDFVKNSQYGAHRISAYQIFKDNLYTGVGIKNFRVVVAKEKYESDEYLSEFRHATHPHQLHHEFLSETGIIGYISFLIFVLFSLFISIKSFFKSRNLYQLSGIIFVITSVLPLIPSGSFFSTLTSGIFWLNFAFMIGHNRKIKF